MVRIINSRLDKQLQNPQHYMQSNQLLLVNYHNILGSTSRHIPSYLGLSSIGLLGIAKNPKWRRYPRFQGAACMASELRELKLRDGCHWASPDAANLP